MIDTTSNTVVATVDVGGKPQGIAEIGRAKTSTGRLAAKTSASAPIRRHDLADIRAWASKNGHTVSTRGRISTEVIAAYEAAPGPQGTTAGLLAVGGWSGLVSLTGVSAGEDVGITVNITQLRADRRRRHPLHIHTRNGLVRTHDRELRLCSGQQPLITLGAYVL